MIFKIQLPIESSEASPPCLVYNKDRSWRGFVPVDDEIRRLMGRKVKKYFEAEVLSGGKISLLREVAQQDW